MVKPGALLLLLAVAASQVDLTTQFNISDCPISYYGQEYSWVDVTFNQDSAAICFKDDSSDPPVDCLLIEDEGVSDVELITWLPIPTEVGSSLHAALPGIQTNSTCYVDITLLSDMPEFVQLVINVYNFNDRAAVKVLTTPFFTPNNLTVQAKAGSLIVDEQFFLKNELVNGSYMEVSGCRDRGIPLLPDSVNIHSETCEFSSCDESLALTSTGLCEGLDVCYGNDICGSPTVACTVTGSTVIDFNNRAHTIPDRCAYNLIKPVGTSTFVLAAVFRERRFKNVPFLDELILNLTIPGVAIYLKQGGQVWVDGDLLDLNATAQEVLGLGFSRDDSGVTVQLPDSAKIFFDGNTAHISAPPDDLESLCGNPLDPSTTTTVFDEKSTYSDDGCEVQHDDIVDSSIDCIIATEHCNLMGDLPFAACHDYIDPEPYINACINTSCMYPNVDGLICQFLEAYAVTCDLRYDITLGDWKSAAGCAAVLQHSCRDQYCSDHEFCGEKLGETRCLCRALFADMYRPTNSLGDPIVCAENSASVTLAACLLWDKGVDYTSLHLIDPNCVGDMDYETHMVTFSFESNTCGTEVTMYSNSSDIVFRNTIMTRNTSLNSNINRHHEVQIEFSCVNRQPDIRTMNFQIADSSVVQQIASGGWNYTLTLAAYSDPAHVHLLEPGSLILLNQRLWLELTTDGLDEIPVAMVTDACWATDNPSPDVGLRHDLVVGGCPSPDDDTVEMGVNGQGSASSFSFSMFEFYGEDVGIYLHCQVELCPMDPSCVPDCSGGGTRKRRSAGSDGNPALITMAWKK